MIHNSNNRSEKVLSIFVTSKPNYTEDQSTFNTAYLLYGLNGVLCLFLFALIFHFCKKSNLLKRTNWNYITHGENNIQDESQKQDQQVSRQSYDTISESAKTVEAYRSLESEYDEIDEKLQIQNSLSLHVQIPHDYEKPKVSSRNVCIENESISPYFPKKDIQVKRSSRPCENNLENIEDKDAYVDIIQ